jgi:diaminopimelate decarboxylase
MASRTDPAAGTPGRMSLEAAASIARRALERGLVVGDAAVFHDLGFMGRRLDELASAFPRGTEHALAIKANPLVEVLREAVAHDFGLEAASYPELCLAEAAACAPRRILFDSPAKTRDEIGAALRLGVTVNADNFDELERVAACVADAAPSARVGLRVNPEVGEGSIASTSTAGARSKFGVPLRLADRIRDAFGRYPWLGGLHLHVGSQGCPLELVARGVGRVADLALAIDAELGAGRVAFVDLGGGLPVPYRDSDEAPRPRDLVLALEREAPSLFADRAPLLMTEHGRWVQAGAGFALARIEYVKRATEHPEEVPIAVVHLGADFLLRRIYRPGEWWFDLAVLEPGGGLRRGATSALTIAGPLCFSGDVLAEAVHLPLPQPGDWLLIRDVGAYTLAMWSRHCSRTLPRVLGYRSDDTFTLLREAESVTDVVAFWSAPSP